MSQGFVRKLCDLLSLTKWSEYDSGQYRVTASSIWCIFCGIYKISSMSNSSSPRPIAHFTSM